MSGTDAVGAVELAKLRGHTSWVRPPPLPSPVPAHMWRLLRILTDCNRRGAVALLPSAAKGVYADCDA